MGCDGEERRGGGAGRTIWRFLRTLSGMLGTRLSFTRRCRLERMSAPNSSKLCAQDAGTESSPRTQNGELRRQLGVCCFWRAEFPAQLLRDWYLLVGNVTLKHPVHQKWNKAQVVWAQVKSSCFHLSFVSWQTELRLLRNLCSNFRTDFFD